MKRQQDRDSPLKGKRSRSSVSRYDDSARDRGSPDRRDRRPNKSPNESRRGRGRDSSSERGMPISRSDNYDDYSRSMSRGYHPKVLCVSNLNGKFSDSIIKDALLREFDRYGEVGVKMFRDGSETLAYLSFRKYEDAREARHAKSRLVLFDKTLQIEPVYDRSAPSKRNRSITPEYGMRGVSPARSSSSANSMGRRVLSGGGGGSGRQGGLDRNPYPRDVRRDIHSDFHHPPHRRDESKKEKFPNYLHHVPPEEDDKATRTLFIGNLEVSISEAELRRIFERYGSVEDIDVKRPPPGNGNAYAFIKFLNLDMAHRAKVEMSGQYIGKFQCKIGYGKATPTTRIWVGGLGSWTSFSHLEREFDRFGAIRKIDFVKGENHAYIQYDSIDAAQAACQEMRGFPLGGDDKRLRVDFADPGPYSYYQSPSHAGFREEDPYPPPSRRPNARSDAVPHTEDYYGAAGGMDNHWPRGSVYENQPYDAVYDRTPRGPAGGRESWPEHEDRRGGGGGGDYRNWNRNHQGWWDDHNRGGNRTDAGADRRKRPRTPDGEPGNYEGSSYYKRNRSSEKNDYEGGKDGLSPRRNRSNGGVNRRTPRDAFGEYRNSGGRDHFDGRGEGSRNRKPDYDKKRNFDGGSSKDGGGGGGGAVSSSENAKSLQELSKCCPMTWPVSLVLKNSAFPTRMHVCSGDPSLVEDLMKEAEGEGPMLRITQRLRLDPPKLDDVSKRVSTSGQSGHCLLLTFPGSMPQQSEDPNPVQQRPLRNLVSYLKQKEAAGVISLPSSVKKEEKDSSGVMYAFPPCDFALELLRRVAPNLTTDITKEDHLVVVVVKGSS